MRSSLEGLTTLAVTVAVGVLLVAATPQQAAAQQEGLNVALGVGLATDVGGLPRREGPERSVGKFLSGPVFRVGLSSPSRLGERLGAFADLRMAPRSLRVVQTTGYGDYGARIYSAVVGLRPRLGRVGERVQVYGRAGVGAMSVQYDDLACPGGPCSAVGAYDRFSESFTWLLAVGVDGEYAGFNWFVEGSQITARHDVAGEGSTSLTFELLGGIRVGL